MASDDFHDDVYDSSSAVTSVIDDHCSLVDEGYWHDNDLILAAELGKALLDRNRKLELALEKSRNAELEKQKEIEFLLKELTNLREFFQRKMAFVDEADCYNQELDQNNRQLMRKMIEDQQKIYRLSNAVAMLEEQVSDLMEKLQEHNIVDYCQQQKKNKQQQKQFLRRPNYSKELFVNEHGPYTSKSSEPFYYSKSFDRQLTSSYFQPIHQNCYHHYGCCYNHRHLNHNAKIKGLFIDDGFSDQPELGAHSNTLSNSVGQIRNLNLNPNQNKNSFKQNQSLTNGNTITTNNNHNNNNIAGLLHNQDEMVVLFRTSSLPCLLQLNRTSDSQLQVCDNCHADLSPTTSDHFKFVNDNLSKNMSLDHKSDFRSSTNNNQVISTSKPQSDTNTIIHTDNTEDSPSNLDSTLTTNTTPTTLLLDYQKNLANRENLTTLSNTNSISSRRISEQIEDLLDDVNFVNCLDRIYNPHIRSQYRDLIDQNYKPQYKQLFRDAFEWLKQIRNRNSINRSNINNESNTD